MIEQPNLEKFGIIRVCITGLWMRRDLKKKTLRVIKFGGLSN